MRQWETSCASTCSQHLQPNSYYADRRPCARMYGVQPANIGHADTLCVSEMRAANQRAAGYVEQGDVCGGPNGHATCA
jgi:hypothetical protein